MRHPRLKPSGEDAFMHVYNRTVGSTAEFPFSDVEKEGLFAWYQSVGLGFVLAIKENRSGALFALAYGALMVVRFPLLLLEH